MFVPATLVLTHVADTTPRVQPVVRPTLFSVSPTTGNEVSPTIRKGEAVWLMVMAPVLTLVGRAMNPLLTVTEGPDGWGTRAKALSL